MYVCMYVCICMYIYVYVYIYILLTNPTIAINLLNLLNLIYIYIYIYIYTAGNWNGTFFYNNFELLFLPFFRRPAYQATLTPYFVLIIIFVSTTALSSCSSLSSGGP